MFDMDYDGDEPEIAEFAVLVAAAHRHSLKKLKEWCIQEMKENEELLEEVRTDDGLAAYPDLVKELSAVGAGSRADDDAV